MAEFRLETPPEIFPGVKIPVAPLTITGSGGAGENGEVEKLGAELLN